MRHLVHRAAGVGRQSIYKVQVLLGNIFPSLRTNFSHLVQDLRIPLGLEKFAAIRSCGRVANAFGLGMSRNDLFCHCCAGAGHSNNENGLVRLVPELPEFLKNICVNTLETSSILRQIPHIKF